MRLSVPLHLPCQHWTEGSYLPSYQRAVRPPPLQWQVVKCRANSHVWNEVSGWARRDAKQAHPKFCLWTQYTNDWHRECLPIRWCRFISEEKWYCSSLTVPKATATPSMDELRPISLTSALAKVCETFVMRWMMQDMSPSLDPTQLGNRKGRLTSH